MKLFKLCSTSLALLLAGILIGCSATATQSPEVAGGIRKSLDGANLKDVSVTQDRNKGVVTLGGHVVSDAAKAQAENIARSLAGAQVVSDQIAVMPPGAEKDAKAINSALDQGIDNNLDAALIAQGLQKGIKHSVKSSVVTLTGEVGSQSDREKIQGVAAAVPNVQQVVNELQVKNQKASSSN